MTTDDLKAGIAKEFAAGNTSPAKAAKAVLGRKAEQAEYDIAYFTIQGLKKLTNIAPIAGTPKKTGLRHCTGCGKFSKNQIGEYVRPDGSCGYINDEGDGKGDVCTDCRIPISTVGVEAADRLGLTEGSKGLLVRLVKDAGNWSGMPPTNGNVDMSPEERGNLTQLKKKKLLTTHDEEGMTWVTFSEKAMLLFPDYLK